MIGASIFNPLDSRMALILAVTGSDRLPWCLRRGRSEATILRMRIALYSHDTMGLGHFRRNQAIAWAFAESGITSDLLLLAGKPEARLFSSPQRTTLQVLPGVRKTAHGTYAAADPAVSLQDVITLRARAAREALEAFAPDVLIVDTVARGLLGDLEDVISNLRKRHGTHMVLGLRDILDTPRRTQREWMVRGDHEFIRRHYDRIFIYGDRRVFDTMEEYDFPPDLRDRTAFVGYINRFDLRSVREAVATDDLLASVPADARVVACILGGGQGAEALASTFAAARIPEDTFAFLVTGPYADRRHTASLIGQYRSRERLRVAQFIPHPEALLCRANPAILSAGYNTSCEMMSCGVFGLLVPRVRPRREQVMRATLLARLGYADFLLPSQATTRKFERFLSGPRSVEARVPIDLQGLTRIVRCIAEMADVGARCAS